MLGKVYVYKNKYMYNTMGIVRAIYGLGVFGYSTKATQIVGPGPPAGGWFVL